MQIYKKISDIFLSYKNYIIVIAGQSTAKLLMFLISVSLPMLLGVNDYGIFMFAMYVTFVFSQPFVEYGLDQLITKYVSREIFEVVKEAFYLRLFTSLVGFVILMIVAYFLNAEIYIVIPLFLYVFFLSLSNIFFTYFRGRQKFLYESLLLPLFRILIILLIAIFYIFLKQRNSFFTSISFGLSAIIIFIIILILYFKDRKNRINVAKIDKKRIPLFKEGMFIFFSAILMTVYFRIDGVLLGVMINDIEVGIYSVAYRLYEGTIIIPAAIMMVVFPKLASSDRSNFKKQLKKGFVLLYSLAVIVFIIFYFGSEFIIKKFYSSEYNQSIGILKCLSFSVFALFPSYLTTQALIAKDKNKYFLITSLLGAITNLALNLILIPSMKSYAAAIVTVITEFVIFIVSLSFVLWMIKKDEY